MRRFLLIALSCMITHMILAQGHYQEATFRNEISTGFAVLYSTIDVKTSLGYKMKGEPKLGYGSDFMYAVNLSRYFSIQTGIVYHSLFNSLQLPDKSLYRIHINNLQIPFLLRINSDEATRLGFSIFAGPQLSVNLGAQSVVIKSPKQNSMETNRASNDPVISVSDFDAGMAYGGSVNLAVSSRRNILLNLGYLGTFGFTDICGPVEATESNIISEESTKNTFGGFGGITFAF